MVSSNITVRAHSRVIWLLRVGSQIKKSFIDKVQDFGTLTMEQKTFPKSVSISQKTLAASEKSLLNSFEADLHFS